MKKILYLLIALMIIQTSCIVCSGFALFKSYEECKSEIRMLKDSGQYTKAIELTKEMFTYYPEKRVMWLPILSGFYTEIRDLESASEALEEYLKFYPNDYEWKRILAMNYVEQGLYDKSIPLTMECLDHSPDDVIMRLEYSKALLAQKQYNEAEKQCRIYVDTRPNDYKGWWMLGRIMSVKGNKFMATVYWIKVPQFKIRGLGFIFISVLFCGMMMSYYWITRKKFREKVNEYNLSNIWRFGIWFLGLLFVSAAFYDFSNPLLMGHWFTYPLWFAQYVFPIFLLAIGIGLVFSLKWARCIAILFAFSKVFEYIWNLCFSYGDMSKISLSIAVMMSWIIPMMYLGMPSVRRQFDKIKKFESD